MKFHHHVLEIDAGGEGDRIIAALRHNVRRVFRKQGAVVGVSGGVDSAVVLALCVRAFGPGGVTPLIMPERDSSPDSERLARDLCSGLGATPVVEDLTEALEGFGCYRRRDEAVRRVFPDYDASAGDQIKIGLPQDLLDADTLNAFAGTVVDEDGAEETKPLPPREFLQIVAASNFKQRARMSMLYYHAELRNWAVVGTANKNEHGQGFFVKFGDGGADVQPIAHLYKTQVYQLARHLHVPTEIIQRTPTSDTYSAPSTQEEFFFRLPFETMDLIWYALEHKVPTDDVAAVMNLSPVQVRRVFDDLQRKERATEYLRMAPLQLTPTAAIAAEHAEPLLVL